MATKAKAESAKPEGAKATKAAAAPAAPVATPEVDEAAAKAALLNQGSGDGATSTETNGDAGVQGASSEPGSKPGSKPELESAGDEAPPEVAAIPCRTLINQTGSTHRLAGLGVVIGAGESSVIEFRDAQHQAKCEYQIEQIRELGGWAEGCGLHWGAGE